MCGFSGVVSPQQTSSGLIQNSLSAIKHRGPDDTLVFSGGEFYACTLSTEATQSRFSPLSEAPQAEVWLGFNRLSIVDLSDHAMQPFFDDATDTVFMLNGEIYNYALLRSEYLSDVQFVSESDSEVAFRLYLRLGDEFVHRLRGMFSIVVWHPRAKRLKAWRDRLGMKPFYYSLVDDTFVFSSEMKGLFATGLVEKELNYQGLAYSMYLTTCPAPLTIYNHVHALPAASQLTFEATSGQIAVESYWQLTYEPYPSAVGFEEFSHDVDELCRLHQTGDVPKAIMLSGGTDSGLLAYYLGRHDSSLACLTIYAENHSTDEREYARLNAANAGLQLTCLPIPAKPSAEELAGFLMAEEEPNSGPEAAVFLCKEARERGYKVLYNALGPDEIFGGYPYFKTLRSIQKLAPLFQLVPAWLVPKSYRTKYSELKQFGGESFPLISRALFSWDEICRFLAAKNADVPEHPIAYLKKQVMASYPGFEKLPMLKKASYLDICYYIASHHTFRSDQPSMKYSIEMRFPFLDHVFLQKYFNQPGLFDSIGSELKPVFRQYARQVLPPAIFEMSKRGFTMPTELWNATDAPADASLKESIATASRHYYTEMLNKLYPSSNENAF